jgi:hypothetical protein
VPDEPEYLNFLKSLNYLMNQMNHLYLKNQMILKYLNFHLNPMNPSA